MRWRSKFGAPTRSAPTVVEGRLFVTTIEDRLLALAADDGRQLWSHQAANATTSILGGRRPPMPTGWWWPASARANWRRCVPTAAASRGPTRSPPRCGGGSLADFSAIRGLPVVGDGRVYAISMGGLAVAVDLPSGRRLWER